MSKIFAVFLFLILPRFAFSQTTEICENTAREISPVLLQTLVIDYRPLMCSDNVLALKKSLQAFGVQAPNAHVVVIRHKSVPYVSVKPLKARLTYKNNVYKEPTWMFHVFLVVDGLVFDMDYTDEPQAIGFEPYMASMWNPADLPSFVAQVTSMESYSQKDVYGAFSKEKVLSISELMTFFTNTTCLTQPAVHLLHDSI